MDEVKSYVRIVPFIEKYGLDESEFAEPASEYGHLTSFLSQTQTGGAGRWMREGDRGFPGLMAGTWCLRMTAE